MIVVGSIVTVCIFNPWVVLAVLPLGAVVVFIRQIYVPTAQHMLRIQSKGSLVLHISRRVGLGATLPRSM